MSGQHCENYDVKRETAKCWPLLHVIAGISTRFSNFAFVFFCYITNHLMTGPLGNSEFCFPRISMFLSTSSRATLGFSLFPSGQVLTIVLQSSERLHTRGQQPRKFIGTNTLNTLLFIFFPWQKNYAYVDPADSNFAIRGGSVNNKLKLQY